jgi:light-regulated signal transduction histidine kinase (bacteriophytochrome)
MEGVVPVIYGSQTWLSLALAEYVRYLAERAEESSRFVLTARSYGNYVVIQLQNTGFSVPPALEDPAFMPFFQDGAFGEGLGLGLTVSKRVIELHRGRIRLSEDADGSMRWMLELAVGDAPAYTEMDALKQAQRYAEDLSQLMQRKLSLGDTDPTTDDRTVNRPPQLS